MSDFHPIDDEDNIWLRPRQKPVRKPSRKEPLITWAACILCGSLFLLIIATGGPSGPGISTGSHALAFWTYPSQGETWEGAFWGPLTSAFVHFELWHVGFNIYWLWIFGRAIERQFGSLPLLGIILASAYLSSTFQMAFTNSGSIGASGIGYALFGFLWIARSRIPDLEATLPDRIVKFFLIWLVACFFLTKANLFHVANAAHAGGLLIGCLIGAVFVLRDKLVLTASALVLSTLLLAMPLFYAPWSTAWLAHMAYQHHDAGRLEKSIEFYDKILAKDPSDPWANNNRKLARLGIAVQTLQSLADPEPTTEAEE